MTSKQDTKTKDLSAVRAFARHLGPAALWSSEKQEDQNENQKYRGPIDDRHTDTPIRHRIIVGRKSFAQGDENNRQGGLARSSR